MAIEANQLQTPDIIPDPVIPEQDAPPAEPEEQSNLKSANNKIEHEDPDGRPEPPAWKDEKRNAIFNKARARRQAETVEYAGDTNDPAVRFGTNVDIGNLGDLERAALRRQREVQQREIEALTGGGEEPPQPPPQPQLPQQRPINGIDPEFLSQRVRAVVDGQERDITVEEALRSYQMNHAADARLQQAQHILAQVKELQRTAGRPPAAAGYDEQTGQEPGQNANGYNPFDGNTSQNADVDMTSLVERIQLGSTEEAADALQTYVKSMLQTAQPAADDASRVLTVLENRNAEEQLLRFAEAHPEVRDPFMQELTARFTHREMAQDLLNAGWTWEQLQQTVTSPRALTELHKQARINRIPNIRTTEQLLSAGYQSAQTWRHGTKAPEQQTVQPNQAAMQDRTQRKQALQPQPAARRMAPSADQQRPMTQEESRAAAVARIRQARSQSV